MVVEDSPTVRALLHHIIDRDPRLELAAVCTTAEEALERIAVVAPDVVSMDIRLPGMNGLQATRQIMSERPTPIVVVADSVYDSTLGIAMNALKAGALSVVEKPSGPGAEAYDRVADAIATQLYIMSEVSVIRRRAPMKSAPSSAPAADADSAPPQIVALAASTGGPPALAAILGRLPKSAVPILVVQHMGAAFMDGFAAWLDGQTALDVKIAQDGETPKPGAVYVAPGDRHLVVGARGQLQIKADPPIGTQRPAATLLFRSLARTFGANAVGVLLTGMGEDGAKGLLEMRDAGALTIVEDASTAVVNGMPGAAAKLGAARVILPLDAIAARLAAMLERAP